MTSREASQAVSEKMLAGWKMLARSCDSPGCYLPLLQSRVGEVCEPVDGALGGDLFPECACAPTSAALV